MLITVTAVLALATLGLGLGLITVVGLSATSGRMVEENFKAVDVASRLRRLMSAQQLLITSRLDKGDTGVATLPGAVFGRPRAELTLRLSYVNFDGAAALEFYKQQIAEVQ